MKDILLYQHLGLGDHIVCNGLIRELCKQNCNFHIVTKPHCHQSVEFMFKDIKNLKVVSLKSGTPIEAEDWSEILMYAQTNCLNLVKIGFENLNYQMGFDKSFYHQFQVNFETRWTGFNVVRDYDREQKLYNKINPGDDYIFIHDDAKRGLNITKNIDRDIKLIRANTSLTNNIFDYLSLIEKAKEVHCIESSFMLLIDSFNFNNKLFFHRYARDYSINPVLPTYQKNWQIIN